MDRLVHAKDLTKSGGAIMVLFAAAYPDGLTLGEMLNSGEGWLVRAAKLLMEDEGC